MAKSYDDYMSTSYSYMSTNSQQIFNNLTTTCQLIHNHFSIILQVHVNYLATVYNLAILTHMTHPCTH